MTDLFDSATDEIVTGATQHVHQRLVDVDEHATRCGVQGHARGRTVERQPEALTRLLQAVCLRNSLSDVAQGDHDAIRIAQGHVGIRLQQHPGAVGSIERQGRGVRRRAPSQHQPQLDQARSIALVEQLDEVAPEEVVTTAAGEFERVGIDLTDAAVACEHDDCVRQVVEELTQLDFGVAQLVEVVVQLTRPVARLAIARELTRRPQQTQQQPDDGSGPIALAIADHVPPHRDPHAGRDQPVDEEQPRQRRTATNDLRAGRHGERRDQHDHSDDPPGRGHGERGRRLSAEGGAGDRVANGERHHRPEQEDSSRRAINEQEQHDDRGKEHVEGRKQQHGDLADQCQLGQLTHRRGDHQFPQDERGRQGHQRGVEQVHGQAGPAGRVHVAQQEHHHADVEGECAQISERDRAFVEPGGLPQTEHQPRQHPARKGGGHQPPMPAGFDRGSSPCDQDTEHRQRQQPEVGPA